MQWQHPGPLQQVRLPLCQTPVNARLRRPSPLLRRLLSPLWKSTKTLQRRKSKQRRKTLRRRHPNVVAIGSEKESQQRLPVLSPLTSTPGK